MAYTHLTMDERYQIALLKSEGFNITQIAERLERHKSTLSREFGRNKGKHGWSAKQAHQKAEERLIKRNKANCRKIEESAWEHAKAMLVLHQHSPEQIAGRLKYEGKDGISRESIYQRVRADRKAGGDLYRNLRSRKQRRSRYGSKRRARPNVLERKGIEERPSIVDRRTRFGDWEGDTIIGAGCNSGVIFSAVERKSRYTILKKLPDKKPGNIVKACMEHLGKFKTMLHTITVDNGGEFTLHGLITQYLDIEVYFARPYHSYERGTNENTNGLVRQYFKKSQRFDNVTDDEVQKVAMQLNHRPRKCLGYQTPHEVISKALRKKGVALRI